MPPNPNDLSDRAAMSLPQFLVNRLPESAERELRTLCSRTPAELALIAEDSSEPFSRRWAAGSVLALIGDPRIDIYDPPMIDIPAATVQLGLRYEQVDDVVSAWSPVGVQPGWIIKECPEYEAHIRAFRIARFPVTNGQFRAFLEDTGLEYLPSSWQFGSYPFWAANHPVWTIPPEAADEYAAWLSARTGRLFRLPAEKEWEYAASGGDGREYPWGNTFISDRANTVEAGPLSTTPVGIYPAGRSPFGLSDMGGNVEEYVADNYGPYPGGAPVADDIAVISDGYRIARGGSFTRYGDLARCRRRHGWYPKPIYAMGFRLAETIVPT